MGFACDVRDIGSIRTEIKEFMDQLFSKYRKVKNATDVYHMEVALFRMTEDDTKPETKNEI